MGAAQPPGGHGLVARTPPSEGAAETECPFLATWWGQQACPGRFGPLLAGGDCPVVTLSLWLRGPFLFP